MNTREVAAASSLLALLIYSCCSRVLFAWRNDRHDRETVYARYAGPLLLALLCAWAIPVFALRQTALSESEMGRLRGMAIQSLAGVLLVGLVARFLLSNAQIRSVGPSLLNRATIRLAGHPRTKPLVEAIARHFGPPTDGRGTWPRRIADAAGLRVFREQIIDVLYYGLIAAAIVANLIPLPRRWADVQSLAAEIAEVPEVKVFSRELRASLALVGAVVLAAWGFWHLGHPVVLVSLVVVSCLLTDWVFVAVVTRDLVAPERAKSLSRGIVVVALALVVFTGFLCAARTRPLGVPVLIVLALAFWVSSWTLVHMLASKGRIQRILAYAVASASLLLFITGPYNEGDIRRLQGKADTSAARQTVGQYLERWLAVRQTEIAAHVGSGEAARYPVFVVAAEGGGIRAAYWTAVLLAAMHDRNSAITDHMLGISGVSGGSVGAGVFVGLVSLAGAHKAPKCGERGRLRPCASKILSADLLSPQILPLLVGDGLRSVVQSPFLPAPLRMRNVSDRTAILEQSLEREFRSATGEDILGRSFAELARWPERGRSPPFIISNATEANTGKRAILTPAAIAGDLSDAIDLGARLDERIVRASTSIVLGARFPGISTTGRFADSRGVLRAVDGGYVDNSGAASISALLRAFEKVAASRGLADKIRPVVLHLRNGEAPPQTAAENLLGASVAGSLVDPTTTLAGVSEGATQMFRDLLSSKVTAAGGDVVELRLDHRGARIPLGWMLATQTTKVLDDRIDELISGNDFRKIEALLHP